MVPLVDGGSVPYANLDLAASAPALSAVQHAVEAFLPRLHPLPHRQRADTRSVGGAGTLAAVAVARECETGTLRVWRTSPASAGAVLAGRLSATALVAVLALAITVGLVIVGYGVGVRSPLEMIAGLLGCIAIFTCIGAALRRSIAVVPFIFGIALPL
jgi:hypothetical protein